MSAAVEEPKTETTQTTETKTPTNEELQASADAFVAEFFDNDRLARHKQKTEEEKAPEPKEEAKAEEKPEPKAEEAKPESKPEEAKKEIAEHAGLTDVPAAAKPEESALKAPVVDEDALAERLAERLKEKDKPAAPDPLEGLSADERDQVKTLNHLAEINPKYRGKNLGEEAMQFWKAEKEYAAEWKKANRGKPYNPDDDEHAEFYAEHEPAVEEADIRRAEKDLLRKEVVEEARREAATEAEKVREEREVEKLVEQVRPVVDQRSFGAVIEMVKQAVPEFAEMVKDGLDQATIAKMEEADPEAVDLIDREAQKLRVTVAELESMVELGKHFKVDIDKRVKTKAGDAVRPHAEIVEIGADMEEAILRQPAEKQKDASGRQFMPRAELQARIKGILAKEGSKEQKSTRIDALFDKVWTISAEQIRNEIVARAAKNVQDARSLLKRREERLMKKAAPQGGNGVKANGEQTPAKSGQSSSPSLSSSSDIVHSKIPGAPKATSSEELVVKSMW